MAHVLVRIVASLLVSCATFSVGGCSDPSPTTPTQPGRVVESVSVSGGITLAEGETATLVASVRWSTGITETVIDGVVWTSDDPRVASVDERGVVTGVAAGDSRIRATFTNVSGTTMLTVTAAGLRTIGGVVHEGFPTEATIIGGASVTAVDASGNVQSAITDGSGRFTLRLRPGVARFTVTAPGYEALTNSRDIAGATDMAFPLLPRLREISHSFPYVYPPLLDYPRERTYRISVHHAGELRASYVNSYEWASLMANTFLEVRDSRNERLYIARGEYDSWARPVRLSVLPGIYKVTFYVRRNSFLPFFSIGAFAGQLRHPS